MAFNARGDLALPILREQLTHNPCLVEPAKNSGKSAIVRALDVRIRPALPRDAQPFDRRSKSSTDRNFATALGRCDTCDFRWHGPAADRIAGLSRSAPPM